MTVTEVKIGSTVHTHKHINLRQRRHIVPKRVVWPASADSCAVFLCSCSALCEATGRCDCVRHRWDNSASTPDSTVHNMEYVPIQCMSNARVWTVISIECTNFQSDFLDGVAVLLLHATREGHLNGTNVAVIAIVCAVRALQYFFSRAVSVSHSLCVPLILPQIAHSLCITSQTIKLVADRRTPSEQSEVNDGKLSTLNAMSTQPMRLAHSRHIVSACALCVCARATKKRRRRTGNTTSAHNQCRRISYM